jgi:tRNA(His) 5'-end guanylyltransferase
MTFIFNSPFSGAIEWRMNSDSLVDQNNAGLYKFEFCTTFQARLCGIQDIFHVDIHEFHRNMLRNTTFWTAIEN